MNHIIVRTSPDRLYESIAKEFTETVTKKQKCVLALPTGNTPSLLYRRIVNNSQIDWSGISIFMLDCYYPQLQNNPDSFATYIHNELINHITIPIGQFHILNSETDHPEVECAEYETAIANSGGLDLAILGLGVNGHIAFNEPGTEPDTLTRRVTILPDTIQANDPTGQKKLPTQALTMGIRTILSAKKIFVLATGIKKADAVKRAISGPVSRDLPASFLQEHTDVTYFLDEAAASTL